MGVDTDTIQAVVDLLLLWMTAAFAGGIFIGLLAASHKHPVIVSASFTVIIVVGFVLLKGAHNG